MGNEIDLGKELLALLLERDGLPFNSVRWRRSKDPLASLYSTCIGVKTEIDEPHRAASQFSFTDFDEATFQMEICNKPLHYSRKVILPVEVRPYFENLVAQRGKR